MRILLLVAVIFLFASCSENKNKSSDSTTTEMNSEASDTSEIVETIDLKNYYIDVHELEPGSVTFEDVAAAHEKDLATQDKHDVSFIKYWVDTARGTVYCLSSASDSGSIVKTHAEAHGLLPDQVYAVTAGTEAAINGGKNLFLDVHDTLYCFNHSGSIGKVGFN